MTRQSYWIRLVFRRMVVKLRATLRGAWWIALNGRPDIRKYTLTSILVKVKLISTKTKMTKLSNLLKILTPKIHIFSIANNLECTTSISHRKKKPERQKRPPKCMQILFALMQLTGISNQNQQSSHRATWLMMQWAAHQPSWWPQLPFFTPFCCSIHFIYS